MSKFSIGKKCARNFYFHPYFGHFEFGNRQGAAIFRVLSENDFFVKKYVQIFCRPKIGKKFLHPVIFWQFLYLAQIQNFGTILNMLGSRNFWCFVRIYFLAKNMSYFSISQKFARNFCSMLYFSYLHILHKYDFCRNFLDNFDYQNHLGAKISVVLSENFFQSVKNWSKLLPAAIFGHLHILPQYEFWKIFAQF